MVHVIWFFGCKLILVSLLLFCLSIFGAGAYSCLVTLKIKHSGIDTSSLRKPFVRHILKAHNCTKTVFFLSILSYNYVGTPSENTGL